MSTDSQQPDDPRLNRIIEEYLRRQDAGQSTDLESICRSYPDLADQLRAFLSDENAVRAASQDEEPDDRPTADRETIAPRRHTPSGKLVGETIAGRYRLMQVIGSGAMGCVYLAEDLSQKSKVAIKTPFFEGAHEKERKRRFRREAAALAAIRHPNICRVYEHGEHQGTPYLVMEYVEGPTLADLVSTPGIDPRQAAILCRGIAEGLVAAHAAGVVHRDLKPRNVLIDAATRRVVVTDFGLARFTDETETKLTLDGVVLGTPAYMPPEQVDGTWDQVGPRSDLYSLGIVLYELLTGQPPFTGRMAAVLGRIMRDKITPVRKIRSELDPEIDHICQTLTAKKPAERYPSARAVAAALTDYLANSDPAAKAEKRQATQLAAEREARRERVTALCRKGKYAEAATVLKEIRQWTGPGTEEYVRWATQEMERLRALPQKLRQDQSVLAETAQQLLAKHDYTSVVQLLQDVPPDYRSEAVQKLLDKAIDRQDEVDLLQVAIQDAVERRQFGGLEKALRRLLVLKPGYTPAQKMLSALREYQRRGIRDLKFSKSGELIPPEGLGLLSGVRLAALVGALALLVTYWLVKVYLASSPKGELMVTVSTDPSKLTSEDPSDQISRFPMNPVVEAQLSPVPEGPAGVFHQFRGSNAPIDAMKFSYDGKYLLSITSYNTLRIWDLKTLSLKKEIKLPGVGRHFEVSRNGYAALTNWTECRILDIDSGEVVAIIPDGGIATTISNDGKRVAISMREAPFIPIWSLEDLSSPKKVCQVPRGKGEGAGMRFLQNGQRLLTSASDGDFVLYDTATGEQLWSNQDIGTEHHRFHYPDQIPVTQDEKYYLCWQYGGKTLHELATGKLVEQIPDAMEMLFLPGDRYLTSVERHGGVGLYDLVQRKTHPSLTADHVKPERLDADRLAVSPDGRLAATAGGSYWDGQKGGAVLTGDYAIYLWRLPKNVWPNAIATKLSPGINGESTVYLDDLQEQSFDVGYGGRVGKHGLTTDSTEPKILPDGTKVEHSLWPHPKTNGNSSVSYDLDGKYREFQGSIFHDTVLPLQFKILGDGKTLWSSEEAAQMSYRQDFRISVHQVQKLELRIHCKESQAGAWGWWLEPRLMRNPLGEESSTNTAPSQMGMGRPSIDLKPIEKWTIKAGETKWYDVETTTSNCDDPIELTLSPVIPGIRVEVTPSLSAKSPRGRVCLVAAPNAEGTSTHLRLSAIAKSATDSITIPFTVSVQRNERLYVDRSAKPGGDGKSWKTAFSDLQAAMAVARLPSSRVRDIWVAKGIYKPVGKGGSRESTFELVNGVAMYGGFEGTESSLTERQADRPETILSGDLNSDDDPGFKKRGDNAFHVVKTRGSDAETILDGFTIASGFADGPANSNIYQSKRIGGGLLIDDSRCRFSRCIFRDNAASDWGGAGFLQKFEGRFVDCEFLANRAVVGGAICTHGPPGERSRPPVAFQSCRFQGNRANVQGGAIQSLYNPVKVVSCKFVSNHVEGGGGGGFIGGGAIFQDAASLTAINCFFHKNDSIGDAGAINIKYALDGVRIIQCTFSENSAKTHKGLDILNWDYSRLTITNSILSSTDGDPLWLDQRGGGTEGVVAVSHSCVRGGYAGIGNIDANPMLLTSSATLDGRSPCIDAGTNLVLDRDEFDLDSDGDTAEPIPVDIEGNPRVRGKPDMGAFESRVTKDKD